jgi:hypothetical protein
VTVDARWADAGLPRRYPRSITITASAPSKRSPPILPIGARSDNHNRMAFTRSPRIGFHLSSFPVFCATLPHVLPQGSANLAPFAWFEPN